MHIMNQKTIRRLALVGLIPLAACSEILSLDVESPGRIADSDLNNAEAVPGLVAGMSYDLTQAINGALQDISLASGELWHGGSYDFGTYPRGILLQAPEDWNGEYASMEQARWVAEAGLKRIAKVLPTDRFERNANVARGYLLAGFANRMMGEVQCQTTVDFDGEPSGIMPRTENFNRADSLFTRAIAIGTAAGATDIVNAAYGGRASIRAWLGNWAQAVNDASQVPIGFQYDAIFSTAVGAVSNDLVYETNSRKEFTVFNTVWAQQDSLDPRVPWRIAYDNAGQVEKGQDGETDFYRQLKYVGEDADQPLTKGTEMLILRAEAALRAGQLGTMTDRLNEARAFYGLDPIAQPATVAEAWPVMRMERAATLWLEGRYLYDLHRWKEEGGVVADPFAADRDTCFPISDEEMRTNPNIGG